MLEMLICVFNAFTFYVYAYILGIRKLKALHIIFAIIGFIFEGVAVYLMNEKLKEVMLYKTLSEIVVFHHIVISCVFLVIGICLILTGFSLAIKDGDIIRKSHKILVGWFTLSWVLATGSGLYLLY